MKNSTFNHARMKNVNLKRFLGCLSIFFFLSIFISTRLIAFHYTDDPSWLLSIKGETVMKTPNNTDYSKMAIRILRLKCHKTCDAGGTDEIYLKTSDKSTSGIYKVKAGETIYVNYDIPLDKNGKCGAEVWDDDGLVDEQIGFIFYDYNPPLPGMFESGDGTHERSKRLTGSEADYTLYFKYVKDRTSDILNSINPVSPHFMPGDDMSSEADPKPWIKEYTKGWMSKLPDNTKLKDISIPGTHDSAARYGGVGPECQSWTIREQLDAGIRFFDIRVTCMDGILYIYHGDFNQFQAFNRGTKSNNQAIYFDFQSFLIENPSETIILRLSNAGAPTTSNELYDINCDWKDTFINDIYNTSAFFYNTRSEFNYWDDADPTLGEVRGKIFLTDKIDGNYKIEENHYEVYFGLPGTFNHCDACLALPDKKEAVIVNTMKAIMEKAVPNNSPTNWYMSYLSGAVGMTPINCADHVNEAIYEYLSNSDQETKRKLGIMIMDYPDERLIYRIIQSNFDLK